MITFKALQDAVDRIPKQGLGGSASMTDFEALQDAVDRIREHFGAAEAIIVLKDPRGFNATASSGVGSHHDAVLLLAGASHSFLLGHDEAVRAGAAGEDAQRIANTLLA